MKKTKEILEALEKCTEIGSDCNTCPYFKDDNCDVQLMRDAKAKLQRAYEEIENMSCFSCKHYEQVSPFDEELPDICCKCTSAKITTGIEINWQWRGDKDE